jgi:hypothetical protein
MVFGARFRLSACNCQKGRPQRVPRAGPSASGVAGQPYNILFTLQRADGKLFADLRMTVESAYPSDGSRTRPRLPNSIRFKVLACKVLRREPVRFAPR